MSEAALEHDPVGAILRSSLVSQTGAVLATLRQAIELCSESLWVAEPDRSAGEIVPFWRIVYHILYYTHLYLGPDERSFTPWDRHQTGIQDLDDDPAPPGLQNYLELPHRPPQTGIPYTREEMLEYLDFCEAMVGPAMDSLDLLAPETGFSWHRPQRPKFEQMLAEIRHVQHHTSQLAVRVRRASGASVDWVGSRR